MHIQEMNADQLHREIARLEQASIDIERSIYDAQVSLNRTLDRQHEAMERLQMLRDEADDARAFGPDYFEGPGHHSPDLLDSHPMGEVFRVGPSNY